MPVRRYCSILVGLWNKITIKSHTILQLSSHDKQKKTKPTAKVQQHTRRWNSDGWLRQQGSPHLPSLSSIPRGKAEGRGLRLHARAPTRPALTSGTAARAVPARAAAGARKRSGGTGRPRTAGGDPRPRSRAGTPRANRAASDRRRGNAKGESRVCAVFLSKVTRPSSSGTAVRPSSARPPPRDEGRGPRCQRLTGRRLPDAVPAAARHAVRRSRHPGDAEDTEAELEGERAEGERSGAGAGNSSDKKGSGSCEPRRAWQRLRLHSTTWKNRRLCKASRTST